MDDQLIGRRVAHWRNRRKMSQQVFADRLGKSKSWVDKVERGVRRLDRFSVIHEIADVLQLDVQMLLGREPTRRPESVNCVDVAEVGEIRAALERYDKIGNFSYGGTEVAPLAELSKAVDHAWLTFQHSRYGVLARTLPRLLRDAQAAEASYDGDEGTRAAHLLGQVYQVASSTLRKLGENDLSWLAGDRAVAVCQRANDELLAALAMARVANALAALGRFRPALENTVNIANQVAPSMARDATPQRLSVYGMVLLQAAMAAARLGDVATVRDLISAAAEAAKQLGGDANHYWTAFGPTNVILHSVTADVEMGEGGRALQTHATLDPLDFSAMMPERRAHYLLDLARGLAQIGELGRATETLLDAERLAPSEIRCRPIAHELITDLLRRTPGASPPALLELADQIGFTG